MNWDNTVTDDKQMTGEEKNKLWVESIGLNNAEKRSLLGFLFGWCGNDEHFLKGVKRFMTNHKGENNELP